MVQLRSVQDVFQGLLVLKREASLLLTVICCPCTVGHTVKSRGTFIREAAAGGRKK